MSPLSAALAALAALQAAQARAAADFKPSWDQVANIKDTAERLGKLHRARGARAAYDFIDACYRTHSLAENFGQAFESCIAQDFMESQMLARLYSRMPRDMLAKLGAPTPEHLTAAMGRRVGAAFAQYNIPATYGLSLKKLVDEHGMPVFVKIVLPEAVREMEEKSSKSKEK
jgi:hypothetical protein